LTPKYVLHIHENSNFEKLHKSIKYSNIVFDDFIKCIKSCTTEPTYDSARQMVKTVSHFP